MCVKLTLDGDVCERLSYNSSRNYFHAHIEFALSLCEANNNKICIDLYKIIANETKSILVKFYPVKSAVDSEIR